MSKPRIRVRADGTFPGAEAALMSSGRMALSTDAPSFSIIGKRAYDAASFDRHTAGWNARLRAVDDETNVGRDTMVARARDVTRNNPIISGALDRRTEMVVGARIRLMAQPAFEVLGETAQWADDWSQAVEQQFQIWDRDAWKMCDARQQQSFGQIVRTAFMHYMRDGEACAAIMLQDRSSAYRTCVNLIDPDRLSNPDLLPDNHILPNGRKLVAGIEYGRNGSPVAYHVRVRHPASSDGRETYRWERIQRFGPTGRHRFVHAYRSDRADQRRGVSRFVSALRTIKQFATYDQAELEAATLNAVMAAVFKTDLPSAEAKLALAPVSDDTDATEWNLADQINYRDTHPVNLGAGVQTIHTLPNESFDFTAPARPAAHYPEFQATGLRSMAAGLGLSYPQLSQDWADINYSSARTLLNEIWRSLLDDRWMFTQDFCTPIFAAFLEESVWLGKTVLPGGPADFYRYRAELTMCEWFGPGRGSIDPLKEAKADDLNTIAGRTTPEFIAADEGRDFRDIARSRLRVKRTLEKMGLDEAMPVGSEKVQAMDAGADQQEAQDMIDEGDDA